jgi:hypothetical protein
MRARAAGLRTPRRSLSGRAGGRRDNVLPLPLGWFKQVDVDWVDFADRPYDASFVGSLAHDMDKGGLLKRLGKELLGDGKILSRRQLLCAVEEIRLRQPGWVLHRFFEALRFGTVPICEPLPPRWFYDGAPFPSVRTWSSLPSVLEGLLADEAHQ